MSLVCLFLGNTVTLYNTSVYSTKKKNTSFVCCIPARGLGLNLCTSKKLYPSNCYIYTKITAAVASVRLFSHLMSVDPYRMWAQRAPKSWHSPIRERNLHKKGNGHECEISQFSMKDEVKSDSCKQRLLKRKYRYVSTVVKSLPFNVWQPDSEIPDTTPLTYWIFWSRSCSAAS